MITISTEIHAPLKKVWEKWNSVENIQHWAFASDDWAAKGIENNLVIGGKLRTRNFAKDGSAEFEFSGTYKKVEPLSYLEFVLDDNRSVIVKFIEADNKTTIEESFDPEAENPEDLQRNGWQAYLNNFKKFVESAS